MRLAAVGPGLRKTARCCSSRCQLPLYRSPAIKTKATRRSRARSTRFSSATARRCEFPGTGAPSYCSRPFRGLSRWMSAAWMNWNIPAHCDKHQNLVSRGRSCRPFGLAALRRGNSWGLENKIQRFRVTFRCDSARNHKGSRQECAAAPPTSLGERTPCSPASPRE